MLNHKKMLFAALNTNRISNELLPYIKMMAKRGYEIHVLTTGDLNSHSLNKYIEIKKLFYLKIYNRPLHPANILNYRKIKKILKTEQYHIIHTSSLTASLLMGLAARRLGTKTVYMSSSFPFYQGAPLLKWRFYPFIFFSSLVTDQLITTNPEDYRFARKRFKKHHVRYIPGAGYKLRHTNKSHEIKHFLRVVLCFCDFTETSGPTQMLSALPHILDKNEDLEVWFIGQGKALKECIKLCEEMNLSRYVEWMGSRYDPADLLNLSELSIFLSSKEIPERALLQAMAYGNPIIALKCREYNQYVIDGQNGYLIHHGDHKLLANACSKILNDPMKNQMSDRSRFLSLKYDIEHVKQLLLSIYE